MTFMKVNRSWSTVVYANKKLMQWSGDVENWQLRGSSRERRLSLIWLSFILCQKTKLNAVKTDETPHQLVKTIDH